MYKYKSKKWDKVGVLPINTYKRSLMFPSKSLLKASSAPREEITFQREEITFQRDGR